MKLDVKVFNKRLTCALFLAVFVLTVTSDPVFDVLFAHQDGCDICGALAGGHGVINTDASPLPIVIFILLFVVILRGSAVPSTRKTIPYLRGPPIF